MPDIREVYEMVTKQSPPTPDALGRQRTRQLRATRNKRIGALTVAAAIAFLASVWIVTTRGPLDGTRTPGGTGPTVSANPDAVGFIGLPPEGATPSTPEAGEVVLRANGRCTSTGAFCEVRVYADGRLIWIRDGNLPYGANERTTGLLEQRLTPAGVELLRSAFDSTGRCSRAADSGPLECIPPVPGPASFPAITAPGWVDPSWGLPASAWEDPAIRAFVPARFGACFLQENRVSASSYVTWQDIEPSRVLAWIPSSAADLLRGKDVELPWGGLDDLPITCFSLTSEEARAISERLDEAGIERDEWHQPYVLGYQLVGPDRFPEPVFWIGPILPDGEWVVSGFG